MDIINAPNKLAVEPVMFYFILLRVIFKCHFGFIGHILSDDAYREINATYVSIFFMYKIRILLFTRKNKSILITV